MRPYNITVIGKSGQLARALSKFNADDRYNIKCYGRDVIDLTKGVKKLSNFINNLESTDIVINSAAYTAVDEAEREPELAMKVNSEAPGVLARLCLNSEIPFIHISTDYVFNGKNKKPYQVNDLTEPLGVYGASKLAGEKAVLSVGGFGFIMRTAWVYDGTGKNFLTTILKVANKSKSINIVNDQFGRPTYSGHLAEAILQTVPKIISKKIKSRIFHITGSGEVTNWAEFAKEIYRKTQETRINNIFVNEIPSSQYPTPAKRPAYSVLDLSIYESNFEIKLPDWREGLEKALKEWDGIRINSKSS